MPAEDDRHRPLSSEQYGLLRFMLGNAAVRAASFVSQLDRAPGTNWRCPCGCASFKVVVQGKPGPSGGMEVLADFNFGTPEQLCGIYVYARNGVLAGVEVVGYAGGAPKQLPKIESLVVDGEGAAE